MAATLLAQTSPERCLTVEVSVARLNDMLFLYAVINAFK